MRRLAILFWLLFPVGAIAQTCPAIITSCPTPTYWTLTVGGAVTFQTPLPLASGGTGTASPGLIQGTNVTITGSWPNQTINASGGGGGGSTLTFGTHLTGTSYNGSSPGTLGTDAT